MTDAAAIGVGEAAAIEELCGQFRRVEAAERRLRVGRIGQPKGANASIAPRLAPDPGERVATVLGLAQIFRETAARMITAATVLIGDGIAVPDEIKQRPRPATVASQSQRCACIGSAPICRKACVQGVSETLQALPADRHQSPTAPHRAPQP